MSILAALYFGGTSDLYKRLVVSEQKVDTLNVDAPRGVDASALQPCLARVQEAGGCGLCPRPDHDHHRPDAVPRWFAADRLAEAKSFNKYAFARNARQHRADRRRHLRFRPVPAVVRDRQLPRIARWTR